MYVLNSFLSFCYSLDLAFLVIFTHSVILYFQYLHVMGSQNDDELHHNDLKN